MAIRWEFRIQRCCKNSARGHEKGIMRRVIGRARVTRRQYSPLSGKYFRIIDLGTPRTLLFQGLLWMKSYQMMKPSSRKTRTISSATAQRMSSCKIDVKTWLCNTTSKVPDFHGSWAAFPTQKPPPLTIDFAVRILSTMRSMPARFEAGIPIWLNNGDHPRSPQPTSSTLLL